jgi:hypothetical protein
MRRLIVVIFATILLATTALAKDNLIEWTPVCRHNAVYWALTVGEQFPTRIMYGWYETPWGTKYYHVQPQVYIGDQWWYFEVVEHSYVRLLTKPEFTLMFDDKEIKTEWKPDHIYTIKQYVERLYDIILIAPQIGVQDGSVP